jgi:hypothetical protein
MTLIIETGTGVAGAEAYATASALDVWSTAFHGAVITGTEAEKESAIRRAVAYLDSLPWHGVKTFGRDQDLSWPRSGVRDRDGYMIDALTIPPEVIEAQHILARQEAAAPGSLAPTYTPASQKVLVELGPMKWQADTPRGADAQRATVAAAMDCLRGLISSSSSNVEVVRA